MSEDPVYKRMKFNPHCLDPNPNCFLNGIQPLIIISTNACGKVVPVYDLVNNEPACEKFDFSDTPAMDDASENYLFSLFDMKVPVNNVFESTKNTGTSDEFRKFQFANPATLSQTQRQRYETAMLKRPVLLAKPRRNTPLPFEECTVEDIIDALPGKSSKNPVTLEESEVCI